MDTEGRKRGTLRVFLGAAPGVGKTYAMLDEAHRRRERGVDIVVGLVETHGRAQTAMMLEGLYVVPRLTVRYRDASFTELDVAAVIARRPAVALVDELAHGNVPGSRNPKRWQDVEELLDVLPPFGVARPGNVAVGELVDERDGRSAGDDCRDVEFGEARVPVAHGQAWHDVEALEHHGRLRAPVRLDQSHDDVDAAFAPTVRLVEHRVGLADPGRRAEEHAQGPALPPFCVHLLHPSDAAQSSTASAALSSRTLTRGSPRKPRSRPLTWSSTSCRTASGSRPRARATRSTCSRAYSGEMSGSRPEPEAVTASAGTADGSTPVS